MFKTQNKGSKQSQLFYLGKGEELEPWALLVPTNGVRMACIHALLRLSTVSGIRSVFARYTGLPACCKKKTRDREFRQTFFGVQSTKKAYLFDLGSTTGFSVDEAVWVMPDIEHNRVQKKGSFHWFSWLDVLQLTPAFSKSDKTGFHDFHWLWSACSRTLKAIKRLDSMFRCFLVKFMLETA